MNKKLLLIIIIMMSFISIGVADTITCYSYGKEVYNKTFYKIKMKTFYGSYTKYVADDIVIQTNLKCIIIIVEK